MTPYAEVIGDPIAHSKSPMIHGFWLERLGLKGEYRKAHVHAEALEGYFRERRADPAWRGCNVTIPHKQAVMPLLDRIDATAREVGAVNVVVREGEALVGYNSDVPGFLEPLATRLAEPHLLRTARIIGAGGAARAIAAGLWAHGFTLIFFARDVAKAQALADRFDAGHVHVAPLASLAEPLAFDWGEAGDRLDLLVNASSLGMQGYPPLAIDLTNLPPGAIVYDAVYAPLDTELLVRSRDAGFATIDGLRMLVGQARSAFARFFGAPAPDDPASDAELRALLTA